MQPEEMLKKFLWFSVAYFTTIIFVSFIYCQCQPWLLHVTMYIFYVSYLVVFYFGRRFFMKMGFNPLSFLILSFGLKLILVIGFALFLIEHFHMDQKLIIFLYVMGYIVASIFDFSILAATTKSSKE